MIANILFFSMTFIALTLSYKYYKLKKQYDELYTALILSKIREVLLDSSNKNKNEESKDNSEDNEKEE